jgi:hypothetical protein
MTAVRVGRVVGWDMLVEQLLSKPSGVYLVTVHQRAITKVAVVDREINLQGTQPEGDGASRKRRGKARPRDEPEPTTPDPSE